MVTDKKKIEPLCEQATCTIIGAAIEHHGEQGNRLCGAPRQNAWRAGANSVYPDDSCRGVSALRTKNKEKTAYMFLDSVLELEY